MTFFLFACLALVALQGPLGWLTPASSPLDPRLMVGDGWWSYCVDAVRATGLEGAFFPLLLGGIALFIILDYAS